MRRRRLLLGGFELPAHFFLTLKQNGHLRLQTVNCVLLFYQYIIQCLNGVILKSQAALKIHNPLFKRHDLSSKKVKACFNLLRISFT